MDQKLVLKIDKKFNEFIRERDTLDDNTFICISCGKRKPRAQMDAGHYWSRRHMGARWHEKNVNGQCKYCNCHEHGNGAGYTIGLKKKYGKGILEELEVARFRETKLSDFEGQLILKEYQDKVKALKKERKLKSLKGEPCQQLQLISED